MARLPAPTRDHEAAGCTIDVGGRRIFVREEGRARPCCCSTGSFLNRKTIPLLASSEGQKLRIRTGYGVTIARIEALIESGYYLMCCSSLVRGIVGLNAVRHDCMCHGTTPV